ncbi:MAG: GspE/PulE family protein [Verrucomicrobia bacterium]|nr:GspE/PulE family protein [Verrucomicrobiota bacterium]
MEAINQTTRYLQSLSSELAAETAVLVDYLMIDAIKAGASDIHIEPWENTLSVRMRVNGVLTELVHLPLDLMEKISGRLKVMANLVTYQTTLPQEGHAVANPEVGGVELRISVFPTVRGEKIVIRLFDPSNRSFDLSQLGFEDETLTNLMELLSKANGLILLTGPTGSGKTTAIYAALYYLVQKYGSSISISTVEDPVECHLPTISQAQINPTQEFTYPIALRSLMRQDPQVIMVGEIRDPETAAIAVQAGLTGHLVISTIHSGSTAGVFARLINMNVEPFLLASSITGILGLRLIRNNCTFCTEPYEPDPMLLDNLAPEEVEDAIFRHGAGCPECMETGYEGRSAITEFLLVNEAIRETVMQKRPTREIQQLAIQSGMNTLWHNGLQRAMNGQTPLEEICRVIAAG